MSESLYGVTDLGFNIKPIDVLETEAQELLVQFFGSSVDLSQTGTLWKVTQVPIVEVANSWVVAEQIFYSCFIATAEGGALDLLGDDIGLTRNAAESAVAELEITKSTSSAVTVPDGSLFETDGGIQFATDGEITIPAGDPATTTGTVNAVAVIAGEGGMVGANTITTPSVTIPGVASSDNASASFGGEDEENDEEYRKRIRADVRATWTNAAIRSAALDIDGVAGVKIIEAATSYTCLVVPQTVFDSDLQDEIEAAIEVVTPVTVEFTVEEAESVLIDVVADVVLEDLYSEVTAESDASVEIAEYIASLDIDDDVILAKVIQAIMEVSGILNAYNVALTGYPTNEAHTYSTGTLTYALNYTTGLGTGVVVTGTLSGSPHTFVLTTDFTFSTSPAEIVWTGSGDLPDNGTDFYVTYQLPPNAIGDIEINQESIAKLGTVDFTEV